MNEKFNMVSLFSGCGGLDLGLANCKEDRLTTNPENNPFNLIWSNDIMNEACKTYSNNFNKNIVSDPDKAHKENIIYNGDVKNIDFNESIQKNIDIVVGGFPCKDFSILRGSDNRKGIKVERGKLYLEFVRSLVELQPKMFIAENVKGLLSANDGKAYERIIKDFKNLNSESEDIMEEYTDKKDSDINSKENLNGYKIIHSNVVDFSNHGVPQGRERLIIIGVRKDLASEIENINIEKYMKNSNSFEKYPLTTLETFTGEVLDDINDNYKSIMKKYDDYIGKLDADRAKEFKEIWKEYEFEIWNDYFWINSIQNKNFNKIIENHSQILKELNYYNEPLDSKKFKDGSNQEMREQSHVLERLRHIPPGENHRMVKDTEHHVSGMMSNIYKRTHPLKVSPTIISSGGGGTWGYHYKRERGKLTNRERARLQTFPDDFLFEGNNSDVRQQIGNAVPPLGAKRIGESIIKIFDIIGEN